MPKQTPIVALIVAAGAGERAGGPCPKQYRQIQGKAVLAHAIDALDDHPDIAETWVVIGAGQEPLYREIVGERPLPAPVIGGSSRQESVRNGLEAIAKAGDCATVLIHDAARPFTPSGVVDRLVAALEQHDGAVPALPVTDSLAKADGSSVRRKDYVAIQTPQAFHFDQIRRAYAAWTMAEPATDDAEIARAAGFTVALVAGDAALQKLTFDEDFRGHGEDLMNAHCRTGSGYDVHAFAPGDHLWLGGIRIEHDKSLAGHSDADVALHAATDAILGALGEGDIGSHFPPGDAQWANAESHLFLAHAAALAGERGLEIWHLDITIICEAPKIGPHREAMRQRIAEILAISRDSVSVKATTTERLGFTGRGEGIAAQAIATVGGQRSKG
jgi:2-C-methyl-D-erythritol 4-phosphate cytidylyltransferase/2-C-methyl-D-erythritol 2,4-cyclodiphosphate synthase